MKNTIALSLALAFTAPAFAARNSDLGSKCGLTDGFTDELKEVTSLRLSSKDAANLSTLQKQQLIISLQSLLDSRFETAEEAIDTLSEWSSGGDVYISKIEYNGVQFDEVLGYPGDNPVGVIFNENTLHIVAFINDSTINCN